jgi:predicted phage tail protein
MKKIQLLGELGKKFGKSFSMDVRNPAEAVRALCTNFPEFRKHLIDSEKRGVAYKVLVGKDLQSVEDLHNPAGKQTIKFVPVLQGAGGGVVGVIAGVVLIAAAVVGNVFFPGNPISPYLISAGVAMIIGGVVQMLTPMPNLNADTSNNQPDNKPSYAFNGAVNTTAQGYPVPVGYGRMIVGSAVISAGIVAEELPI